MGAMPQPLQCQKTGTYYYRETIPESLRPVMGRGREWKVSLGTKSLTDVRPLFAAESARCEAALALARASLKGESHLQPSDAPRLADRWATAELAAWERDSDLIHLFLARFGGYVVTPLEALDEDEAWSCLDHKVYFLSHPTRTQTPTSPRKTNSHPETMHTTLDLSRPQ